MDWGAIYPLLRSVWTVLAMTLFIAIVVWALMPRRKAIFEQYGQIPLKDGRDRDRHVDQD